MSCNIDFVCDKKVRLLSPVEGEIHSGRLRLRRAVQASLLLGGVRPRRRPEVNIKYRYSSKVEEIQTYRSVALATAVGGQRYVSIRHYG